MRLKITDTSQNGPANRKKKEVMRTVCLVLIQKMCVYLQMIQKRRGGHQKWGREGRYNIYVQVVIVRDQS